MTDTCSSDLGDLHSQKMLRVRVEKVLSISSSVSDQLVCLLHKRDCNSLRTHVIITATEFEFADIGFDVQKALRLTAFSCRLAAKAKTANVLVACFSPLSSLLL